MYVYRIEHKVNKYGPYCVSSQDINIPLAYLCGVWARKHADSNHPGRWGICGITSIEKLQGWFADIIDEIYETNQFHVSLRDLDPKFILENEDKFGQVDFKFSILNTEQWNDMISFPIEEVFNYLRIP